MSQADQTTMTVAELDIGMYVELPESHHRDQDVGKTVEIVDYTSIGEYLQDGMVYAYADPETGEHIGLLNADLLPEGCMTKIPVVSTTRSRSE